jgi:hypothetical protein
VFLQAPLCRRQSTREKETYFKSVKGMFGEKTQERVGEIKGRRWNSGGVRESG